IKGPSNHGQLNPRYVSLNFSRERCLRWISKWAEDRFPKAIVGCRRLASCHMQRGHAGQRRFRYTLAVNVCRSQRTSEDKDVRAWAFTLLELLVVVAIIAILAALLLPAVSRTTSSSSNVNAQARTSLSSLVRCD